MFAETDVQSEPESMSVVILIVFFDFSWRLYFPAPFKIRLTARVIARYVYSRCSWIGVFPSCCVDSLLARKIMLWQIWRELFVVEDSDLVVRRQLDDLLLRQIEQNYHEILPLVLSSRKWLLVHKQRQCVGYICGGKWTVFESFYSIQFFGETVQLFSFWQKLCSAKSDILVSPTKTAILLVDLSILQHSHCLTYNYTYSLL